MSGLSAQRRPPRSGGPAKALVVFLHGYGADGSDLIALAEPLGQRLPDAAFASPNAPGFAPMGGRQWFPLTLRDPSEYARGVVEAAPALHDHLSEELARLGLGEAELALVGFSQGTMMALHVAYRRQNPIACVVGFSGLCPDQAPENLLPAPTLLVHGTSDDVLPPGLTVAAAQTLGGAGVAVEWHLTPGLRHGIDERGIAFAADHLTRHLRLGRGR